MSDFTIQPCSIEDGPAIARINIAAFWTDPSWVVMWPGKTQDYITSQAVLRMPRTLLGDPEHRRQQKVVDTKTLEIVGYARWTLPEGAAGTDTSGNLWPEAQVSRVSEEQQQVVNINFAAAWWDYDRTWDVLDEPIEGMKERLMFGKKYMLLDHVAVNPHHWNRGIGSLLVKSGFGAADKLGLDVFIQAKPRGLGVYTRAGAKLLDQLVHDGSKWSGEGEYSAYFLERQAEKR